MSDGKYQSRRLAAEHAPYQDDPSLIDYLRAILRGWWVLVLAVLLAVGAAAFATNQQQRVYRATSTFIVTPAEGVVQSSNEAVINSINTLDRRSIVNTFAEITTSQSVVTRAAETLGLSADDIRSFDTRAVVLPESFAIEIAVDSADPQRASQLANAIVQQAGDFGSRSYPAYQIRPLDQAEVPVVPVSPQPVRDIALAGLAGLVLGGLGAFLIGSMKAPDARRHAAPLQSPWASASLVNPARK